MVEFCLYTVIFWMFLKTRITKCFALNCRNVNFSNAVWLVGETPVTGLSNQLSAVYSYIPAALLLNANLIVNVMYSRKNFEIRMRQFDQEKDGKSIMSFADFFDWTWFSSYWGRKGVQAFLYDEIMNCFLQDTSFQYIDEFLKGKTKLIQRKKWRSASHKELLMMVNLSRITVPINNGTILRFKSKFKMMSLFNFRSVNSNSLLLQVHESIRPNKNIQIAAEKVLQFLPPNYIVIHLRVEGDVILKSHNSSSDPEFYKELPLIVAAVKESICIKKVPNTTVIYIASGAFNAPMNSYSRQRELCIRSAITQLGFRNIYSRANILSLTNDTLPAELGAYVDLLVARRGKCFVSAHVPSSFSYTAQRMKELDTGIIDTLIMAPNRRYSSYFF